jgi:2-phosphosulfolactate phosphatase
MVTHIHCEWGEQGLEHAKDATDVFVIVDVLSFTTCVDVAASRGALVFPYRWMDMSSNDFAQTIGGILGVSTRKEGFSLSPSSLLDIPAGTRLVLPSPNGSTLSVLASEKPTLAGCLRNARAVARAAMRFGDRITVIAGGERWPDGSLRPAVEDWLGAGAVITHLQEERITEADFSPEAELAARSYQSALPDLDALLRGCYSGQELIGKGRLPDIQLAAQLNVSETAPRLVDGAYQAS